MFHLTLKNALFELGDEACRKLLIFVILASIISEDLVK